jgi:hypothetical protein
MQGSDVISMNMEDWKCELMLTMELDVSLEESGP